MSRFARLFDEVLMRKGTALHLGEGRPPRMRVGADLIAVEGGGGFDAEALSSLVPSAMRAQLELERHVVFTYEHGDRARFRATYAERAGGLSATFQALPSKPPTLRGADSLLRAAESGSGLILCAGPSGSGRTTTVAALVRHLGERRACSVLTLENPIEHSSSAGRAYVTQRHVGAHVPNLRAALLSASFDDADVVITGELDELGAVVAAFALAEQGALIIAESPACRTLEALSRLLSLFPTAEQSRARRTLASILQCVSAQELVPTTNDRDVVAAFEVLVASPAVRASLRNGDMETVDRLVSGEERGSVPMYKALDRLASEDLVRPEIARQRERRHSLAPRSL